jgi:hypothetical protein
VFGGVWDWSDLEQLGVEQEYDEGGGVQGDEAGAGGGGRHPVAKVLHVGHGKLVLNTGGVRLRPAWRAMNSGKSI